MAYASFANFKEEYERAVMREKARTMNLMGARKVPAETAWSLYRNSQRPGLESHIFGRHVSKEEEWSGKGGIDLASKPPGARGTIAHPTAPGRSVSAMEYNFGIVNADTAGSILMMGGRTGTCTSTMPG